MAQPGSAFDDAIAHLDALIARLASGEPAAAPREAPVTKPAVVSGEPIQKAEEVVDLKKDVKKDGKKESKKKNEESPIPDILKGRNLKLPGAKAATPPVASGNEQNDNFDKALMQVAVVQSVENHPNSEKLYVCKVDVGEGVVKQVVAGLKKFVTVGELEGKKVCVILNLKTAKLAGQVSEAMILAGSVATAEGSEIVKVLEPPSGAAPGDRIFQEVSFVFACPTMRKILLLILSSILSCSTIVVQNNSISVHGFCY
ncbi:hypothetical protein KC19_9G144000 [Ceratodon purpureus]|uniref:tRNA-binding domain-containing protein n=1 Tax=Ceratodon purpureus TaxID=3225 RepID=A0A8T0GWA7_CERPU|nr:hypothetical protein KC19_9G144000 [Ceratodon purpureus]